MFRTGFCIRQAFIESSGVSEGLFIQLVDTTGTTGMCVKLHSRGESESEVELSPSSIVHPHDHSLGWIVLSPGKIAEQICGVICG